ncbi:MAG TPA: tetratricopeptide repeat protein, partial [Aquabacterium sp.]|nr:tetratricopeptide repeat protein [Aquabacterium sp.]
PESCQEARARLERQLVDAVMAGAPVAAEPIPAVQAAVREPSPASPPVSRSLLGGMVAFVAVVGVAGYVWLGQPDAWHVGPESASTMARSETNAGQPPSAAASAPHATDSAQITAMTESLAAKLKANPKNAEGWAMLGRSYAVLGRYEDAIAAYKQVIALRPDDAQVHADYADALAVIQGRKLEGEPARLVSKALGLDPNNFKALSLSGTIAFDKQDYKAAADLWERALQHAPTDNPDLVRQISGARDDARQRAGLPPVAATPTPRASEPAMGSQAKVSGRVSLASAVLAQVSPEDTVFIFARAAQGGKMPLAILRKQVKDLPLDFTLDDSLAMNPAMRLSTVAQVNVGARISKGGTAMPQP